ncbi:hypothetical protein AM1_6254 [Acaryochloris marina MBIC11017]|uniref:Uncharacterized protein n=1 Tax=Acaryochloris marina (strain MBIC 11017) TaxID=329726 RepID=B0C669_ACAM1|nr:hypothetical protein AM1_6254 [Acaryochloris marina MBIC11017]
MLGLIGTSLDGANLIVINLCGTNLEEARKILLLKLGNQIPRKKQSTVMNLMLN